MARATITRTLMRDLPPLPAGVSKVRIFDDRVEEMAFEPDMACA